jgi:8-oxo-dGTP diphosphatase
MLDGGFMEEAGTVESASGRPAMGYRLRNRSQAALFPRTFSPRDAAASGA